jgi:acyl dehydratase
MASRTYYLDELAVGQRFTAGPLAVSAAEIKRFAREFDPQPFHLDEEAARPTLFQGLVASGWQTAALTMRMLTDGGMPIATGVIGLGGELSWPLPVRPGDELRATSEVVAIAPSRSKPDRGIVTIRTVTTNQNGETVQVLTAKLIAFVRS